MLSSADASAALSSGCVRQIFLEKKPSAPPVVQLTALKASTQGDSAAPPRMKAFISDGTHFGVAVLTSDVSSLLTSGIVRVNSLVRLKNYVVNWLGACKVCIVLDMEKVETDGELEKVGEPVPWNQAAFTPSKFDLGAFDEAERPADAPLSWRDDPEASLSDWSIVVRCGATSVTYNVHRVVLGTGPRKLQYYVSLS